MIGEKAARGEYRENIAEQKIVEQIALCREISVKKRGHIRENIEHARYVLCALDVQRHKNLYRRARYTRVKHRHKYHNSAYYGVDNTHTLRKSAEEIHRKKTYRHSAEP